MSKRLRIAREALGMTAAAMAERTGLRDRKSWERYERGENAPRAEALSPLIEMGVDAQWLLTGRGPMFHAETKGAHALPAASLNVDLLHDIIDAVERRLGKDVRGLAPDRKALLISEVYAILASERPSRAVNKPFLNALVNGMINVSE